MSSYKTLLRPRLDNSVFDSLSQLGQERNSSNDDVFSDTESVILSGGGDFFDCENQVRFVMDLIHQRVEQSQVMGHNSHLVSDALNESGFGVIEEDNHNAIRSLDLDLGLGFGLGAHDNCGFQDVYANDDTSNIEYHCNTVLDDIIDDDLFFIERRISGLESRVVGFRSDSESEDNENSLLAIDFGSRDEYGLDDDVHVESGHYDFGNGVDDLGDDDDDDASITIPLCWNSLSLEDQRDHDNEDFEWEEVDGRVDEREVLSMFLDEDDDDDEASVSLSISPIISPEDMVSVDRVVGSGNLEWEVLLNATNLGPLPEPDQAALYFGGGGGGGHDDDYIYTADYETVFGQFAEMDTVATTGQPPASRLVVDRLPSVVVTKEEAGSDNSTCAVCKDDMNAGEKAKLLPCTHWYHEDCIVPWLNIRNTCPVCRHELPTDDPDYELRKMVDRATAAAAGHHHVITI